MFLWQFINILNLFTNSSFCRDFTLAFSFLELKLFICCREQCLIRAGFKDIFLSVKREEDEAAMPILPIVLKELDSESDPKKRLILAAQGVFAGNIFDLGAAASAEHYQKRKMARKQAYEGGRNATNNNTNSENSIITDSQIDGSAPLCVANNSDADLTASIMNENPTKSDFAHTRDKLHPRPWLIDDLDLFLERLLVVQSDQSTARYDKAVLFVDNAGPDVLLGMMPFARELLKLNIEVVIAANELPSINDITASELKHLLPDIFAAEEMKTSDENINPSDDEENRPKGIFRKAAESGRFRVVSSGNGLPVIDLSRVSPELSAEVDPKAINPDRLLIVLEGMGRSIETNLRARFACDALNMGMVKHPEVALELEGKMYDCVCRFRLAGQ